MNIHNYEKLAFVLEQHGMQDWSQDLSAKLDEYFQNVRHGDYARWLDAILQSPEIQISNYCLDEAEIILDTSQTLSADIQQQLLKSIKQLMPWRKGPFNMFGISVDAEWRSNLKWQRLEQAIKPLKNRTVLDIGCGNGYYMLRTLGQGASCAIGSDPTLLFLMQFELLKKYIPEIPAWILPYPIQELAHDMMSFDTVFSMGVIYHRRDPLEHLQQLFNMLNSHGQLVLEGLILNSKTEIEYGDMLLPENRYARMNNVWSVPTVQLLESWLADAGFVDIKTVNVTQTRESEQRRTEFMQFESLSDFLDPNNPDKTIEGYPAPCRALLVANKPG